MIHYYLDMSNIPETRLPCGHTVAFCEACYNQQRRRTDWEEWCQQWERPDVLFAVNSGHVLHALGCVDARGPDRVNLEDRAHEHHGSQPLTLAEAAAWLRESHERRRCKLCVPDIQEPGWVKVGRRWRLIEDAE